MKSGAETPHTNKSANARLKTNTFEGVSANCSVSRIDSIMTRFPRKPTHPKKAEKLTMIAISVLLAYKRNVEAISLDWKEWFVFDMQEKFMKSPFTD